MVSKRYGKELANKTIGSAHIGTPHNVGNLELTDQEHF